MNNIVQMKRLSSEPYGEFINCYLRRIFPIGVWQRNRNAVKNHSKKDLKTFFSGKLVGFIELNAFQNEKRSETKGKGSKEQYYEVELEKMSSCGYCFHPSPGFG